MTLERPGVLRSGLLLAAIATAGVALLAGVHTLTRDRIAEQEARVVRERLAQVLPPGAYDNDPREDLVSLPAPNVRGHPGPLRVFRARRDGQPVGVVMEVATSEGYNGEIRLLVGIWYDGTISGVRVTRHRETPGLGDPIETRRSDWIEDFRDRSLGDPLVERWAVRKDGGDFDQFTGATITPRAVVGAVKAALEYYAANRERLFAMAAEGGDSK
jgi:electron transport complex protein RnfG